MSIALIVTAGFGNGTLAGDIANVVTRGYAVGAAVAGEVVRPTGGFWPDYDRYQYDKRKERKRLKELEEQAKRIKDRLDRELALEFRKKEKEESRITELRVLTKLAKEHKQDIEKSFNEKVIFAANKAIMQGNFSAMERLEREIARVKEEEWFLLEATRIILNQ